MGAAVPGGRRVLAFGDALGGESMLGLPITRLSS